MRLAIITTHPIQYYAPLFRLLSNENAEITIKVFYTLGDSCNYSKDPDFGIYFKWDVPLLEGYDFTFVNNTSAKPSTRQFNGVINPTLNKEIEDWEPNAILVIGWAFNSHLKVLRHFHGKIPVLFRGDSNLIDEPPHFTIKKWIRRLFLHWVYIHVDYALYVGKANKEYYLVHGLKQRQLYFAPHSIDNDRFACNNNEYEKRVKSWKSQLGIAEEDFVFLFSGKLTAKKDPELLINAFIQLNKSNTCLIIVGSGELEVELKIRYKSYKSIIFLPFQNQSRMPVVYRLSDIFVLPSKGPGETWGLAVNEAMACKRGIIVSDKCGCAQDLVEEGKNGHVFRSGDIESLKTCMAASLANSASLGEQSYQIIQSSTYAAVSKQLQIMIEKQLV